MKDDTKFQVIFCGIAGTIIAALLFGPYIFISSKRAQVTAFGRPAHISLYNGGKVVREWDSVGKVVEEQGSDGWYFEDAKTHNLVRMSGTVVVEIK